jgi:hypothetical protein
LAGIGNHVRTFLAAGALAVALSVWRSRSSYWPGVVLGVASGFRPDLLVLLFPLFIRRSLHLLTLAVLGCITAVWFAVIVWKTGGPSHVAALFTQQFQSSTQHTSVFSGASLLENFRTVVLATYWTCAGVVSWIWAVPFVWGRLRAAAVREQLTFLAWWFVPPFLFYAIVFVHDPDATLTIIPVTALIGGWVLSMFGRTKTLALAAIAMALNAAIFFASPLQQGKDASYAWVHRIQTESSDVIDELKTLSAGRPAVLVMDHPLITPRQISYYLPQLTIKVADVNSASHVIWLPASGKPVMIP